MPPSVHPTQERVSSFQSRQRHNRDDSERHDTEDPIEDGLVKRTKPTTTSRSSPKPRDNLPKVQLTHCALREIDQRNRERRLSAPASAPLVTISATTPARFARRGGPDLSHLRGHPEPRQAADTMSGRSEKSTGVSIKGKRASAYSKSFERHLQHYGIYLYSYTHPDGSLVSKPSNFDDIFKAVAAPPTSLSYPSWVSFESFIRANERTISEMDVMVKIIPIMLGDTDIWSASNLAFTNLDSITKGDTVVPMPDLYDGSNPYCINMAIERDLNTTIIPTHQPRAPIVPNFFLEAKALGGGADVVIKQVCLDGAIGARAMHSLQNYGRNELVYDGNAYTLTSTYHNGILRIYAHYITDPMVEGRQPEYHMTLVSSSSDMTISSDAFRQGVASIENARKWARKQRDTFIQAANTRATQTELAAAARAADKSPRLTALSIDATQQKRLASSPAGSPTQGNRPCKRRRRRSGGGGGRGKG